jgi:heme a synthase
MVEFTNRVFTGAVSIAVILAVLGALIRRPRRRDLTWLSLSLVFGVIAQAVVGGLSVLHKLRPEWVMAHFLLSMVLVWAATVLHHRAGQPDGKPHATVHPQHIMVARVIFMLTIAVLFIGTMVTGSGPHGGDAHVVRLGFKPHDITKVHGSVVWVLIATVAFSVWRLRAANASAALLRKGEIVIGALMVQGAIGYLQYALHVPAGLVLLHVMGATATWIAVTQYNLAFYERWEPAGIAAYDGPAPGLPTIDRIVGSAETENVGSAETENLGSAET